MQTIFVFNQFHSGHFWFWKHHWWKNAWILSVVWPTQLGTITFLSWTLYFIHSTQEFVFWFSCVTSQTHMEFVFNRNEYPTHPRGLRGGPVVDVMLRTVWVHLLGPGSSCQPVVITWEADFPSAWCALWSWPSLPQGQHLPTECSRTMDMLNI